MDELRNEVKIAVLEEQIRGLREQHKSQSEILNSAISQIDVKLDGVIQYQAKQSGVYKVLIACAAIIGAALDKILAWGIDRV